MYGWLLHPRSGVLVKQAGSYRASCVHSNIFEVSLGDFYGSKMRAWVFLISTRGVAVDTCGNTWRKRALAAVCVFVFLHTPASVCFPLTSCSGEKSSRSEGRCSSECVSGAAHYAAGDPNASCLSRGQSVQLTESRRWANCSQLPVHYAQFCRGRDAPPNDEQHRRVVILAVNPTPGTASCFPLCKVDPRRSRWLMANRIQGGQGSTSLDYQSVAKYYEAHFWSCLLAFSIFNVACLSMLTS